LGARTLDRLDDPTGEEETEVPADRLPAHAGEFGELGLVDSRFGRRSRSASMMYGTLSFLVRASHPDG
jgi:hypothetical protein